MLKFFMPRITVLLLILVLTVPGCFWPFSGGSRPVAPAASDEGVSVEVLAGPSFDEVRKIYFEPFSAGPEAEAGEGLDRLALMMVKGFSDETGAGGRFVLVAGDEASTADAVIRGRIETFNARGHLRKKVLMKVRGDLRSAPDNEVLALLYAQREFRDTREGPGLAAYDIGRIIARELSE